jgi:hypothetical protein
VFASQSAVEAAEISGTASMEATAGSRLSCQMRSEDVRDLTLTPPDGASGTPVRAEAVLDPALAGCPVVLLVDGELVDDSTTVRQDGRAIADTTISGDGALGAAGKRTSTVVLATVDGRALARASFPVVPDAGSPGWILAVLLILLAALALAVLQAQRARRQRRWVGEHVSSEPRVGGFRVRTATVDPTAGPSPTVRLQPRAHQGTTEFTKEGDG